MDNLELWRELAPVNAQHVKRFTRKGGFSGTYVDPTWRFKRMTEIFGPVGVGWWWDVTKHWSETINGETICFAAVKVIYVYQEDPVETGEYIGGTEATRTPDEAYKMAITDALGKCFSAIGLAAEVYMGQHETPQNYAKPEDLKQLLELIDRYKVQKAALFRFIGVTSETEINGEQCAKAIKMIKRKHEAENADS